MSGRVWVQPALFPDVARLPAAPVCRGCELVRGVGWVGLLGQVQPDPQPSCKGIADAGLWFCTEDCKAHYLGREPRRERAARLWLVPA